MNELLSLTHSEIVKKIKESGYFRIEEFVSKAVFDKYGDRSWRYLTRELLITIYFIRHKKGLSLTANNWHNGNNFDERGYRENICDIVYKKTLAKKLYLSGHTAGKALDFTFSGESASDTRKWLVEIANKLPFKIRLEYRYASSGKEITWVHLDTYDEDKNPKVYLFDV